MRSSSPSLLISILGAPSVPAMRVCIATANSVILVRLVREGMVDGLNAATAALEAKLTSFRRVLTTALVAIIGLATIIGMVLMALTFRESGEQNAPVGGAVIGRLTVDTLTAFFFVPVVSSLLHRQRKL